jgi:hypothetical protein
MVKRSALTVSKTITAIELRVGVTYIPTRLKKNEFSICINDTNTNCVFFLTNKTEIKAIFANAAGNNITWDANSECYDVTIPPVASLWGHN